MRAGLGLGLGFVLRLIWRFFFLFDEIMHYPFLFLRHSPRPFPLVGKDVESLAFLVSNPSWLGY